MKMKKNEKALTFYHYSEILGIRHREPSLTIKPTQFLDLHLQT